MKSNDTGLFGVITLIVIWFLTITTFVVFYGTDLFRFVAGGSLTLIIIFTVMYILNYENEIHNNPPKINDIPAHQRYANIIGGRHFLITKHTFLGLEYIRVYCEETERYFYQTAANKTAISKWITTQL